MPASNGTAFVTWREGPDTRGTWGIISLCATTLGVCLWNAIHPDIPVHKTFWSSHKTRVVWIGVGLFIPELLIVAASTQLFTAFLITCMARVYLPATEASKPFWWERFVPGTTDFPWWERFIISWRTYQAEQYAEVPNLATTPDFCLFAQIVLAEPLHRLPSPKESPRRHAWTLAHGFYACMGGFVFDTAPGRPFLPFGETRVRLTPSAFIYLMMHAPELVPDISREELEERSKADIFAKAVLFVQVLYFCLGSVARWQQRQALSLLEATTLARGLCALAAYIMWLYKPFDVSRPTRISGDRARQLCALLWMGDPAVELGNEPMLRRYVQYSELDLLAGITTVFSDEDTVSELRHTTGSAAFAKDGVLKFFGFYPQHISPWLPLYPPTPKSSFGQLPWYLRDPSMPDADNEPLYILNRCDMTRLTLCREALRDFPVSTIRILLDTKGPITCGLRRVAIPFPLRMLVWVLVGLLNGTPHLIALRETFPSRPERVLWTAAAVLLFGSPIVAAICHILILLAWKRSYIFTSKMRSDLPRLFGPLRTANLQAHFLFRRGLSPVQGTIYLAYLAWIMIVLYSFSAAFVLFESLRQVFFLPEGAFVEVSLNKYVPHFW